MKLLHHAERELWCHVSQLLSLYGVEPNVTSLVNEFDWYILPVVNPDGYHYSHTVVSNIMTAFYHNVS